MNSLPHITQLISELAARDKAFAPAQAFALAVQRSVVQAGAIDRHLVEGSTALRVDGLAERSMTDLLGECDNLLSAIQVNLVGESADLYASVSRIRELVAQAKR